MNEVKRYARIGNMVEPTQELRRLYPAMNVYVLTMTVPPRSEKHCNNS